MSAQDYSDSKHSQDTKNKTSGDATPTASRPVRVVVENLPSPTKNQEMRENRKERREKCSLLAQVVTAVLVFLYAAVTILQYSEMRRANRLTQDALLLNKQLIKSAEAASISAAVGFAAKGSTVNIGFVNHGKTSTTNIAHYEVTLESLPDEKQLRVVRVEDVTDPVPREGEPRMPNHFYEIDGFTEEDLTLYRNSREAIRVKGTFRYDDGFGEVISKDFCLVSTNFSSMECGDGVRRYILSLPPQTR